MERVIFKNTDGSIGVIIPTPEALEHMTIEEIAAKDVPNGLQWRIATTADLPISRNYRNAWVDNGSVDVSLEKAKILQKALAHDKAYERAEKDARGNPKQISLDAIDAEINAIDFSTATTLDELYNMWPASIEHRSATRAYKIR